MTALDVVEEEASGNVSLGEGIGLDVEAGGDVDAEGERVDLVAAEAPRGEARPGGEDILPDDGGRGAVLTFEDAYVLRHARDGVAHPVVGVEGLSRDPAPLVNVEGPGEGDPVPSMSFGHQVVEDAELADDAAVLVRKQGIVDPVLSGEGGEDVHGVVADREGPDAAAGEIFDTVLQLHELRLAEASPFRAAMKEKERTVYPVGGDRDRSAVLVGKGEHRHGGPDFGALREVPGLRIGVGIGHGQRTVPRYALLRRATRDGGEEAVDGGRA